MKQITYEDVRHRGIDMNMISVCKKLRILAKRIHERNDVTGGDPPQAENLAELDSFLFLHSS